MYRAGCTRFAPMGPDKIATPMPPTYPNLTLNQNYTKWNELITYKINTLEYTRKTIWTEPITFFLYIVTFYITKNFTETAEQWENHNGATP